MKNTIQNMVLETMEGFYKAGTVDKVTLKEVKAMVRPKVKSSAPRSVIRLRRKLKSK